MISMFAWIFFFFIVVKFSSSFFRDQIKVNSDSMSNFKNSILFLTKNYLLQISDLYNIFFI
jgi:hypothetical protein